MSVKLSQSERLILFNQYEILKNLSNDKHDKKNYEYYQKIVYEGFQHEYYELLQGMSDETPESVSKLVWEVLKLYRVLHNSYYELSEEDKQQLDLEDIKYDGFDGNEEGDYYTYANFILQDMKRYAEIYNNGKARLNSHANRIEQYNRMLAIWEELRSGEYALLSLKQIKSIIEWYK